MATTHTKVGTEETFADPYKVCLTCGAWVTGAIEVDGEPGFNAPCECPLGYRDLCPSWGPIDGCKCPAGSHASPPASPSPNHPPEEGTARLSAAGWLRHRLPLRPGFDLEVELPRDLTAQEVERVYRWLIAIALEDDAALARARRTNTQPPANQEGTPR